MDKKKSFEGLDLFKFVAALLVITLHANPFSADSALGIVVRELVTPVAVPFFFAASGFLFFRTYRNCGFEVAGKKIIGTVRLYLIWCAIYFPFVIVQWVAFRNVSIHTILLYFRNLLFEGGYQTIWFLNALWSGSLIVLLLLKKFKIRTIFLMSLPFYCLSCLLSSWNGLFVQTEIGQCISNLYYALFETTKNGVLFGFTYISMGALLYEVYSRYDKRMLNKSLIFTAIGVVATVIEWLLRKNYQSEAKGCDITFSLLIITAGLLLCAVSLNLKASKNYVIMRKMSTLMFLTQRVPLTVFNYGDILIDKLIGSYIFTANPVCFWLLIMFATVFISALILIMSKKYSVLKKIY